MSTARYIEVDSTYRNRLEWPNPAEFEMLISQTGRKDRNNAVDPVSTASIQKTRIHPHLNGYRNRGWNTLPQNQTGEKNPVGGGERDCEHRILVHRSGKQSASNDGS